MAAAADPEVGPASTVSTDAEISSDAEKTGGSQSDPSVGVSAAGKGPDGLVTLSGDVVSMTWKTWVVIFVSQPLPSCLLFSFEAVASTNQNWGRSSPLLLVSPSGQFLPLLPCRAALLQDGAIQ